MPNRDTEEDDGLGELLADAGIEAPAPIEVRIQDCLARIGAIDAQLNMKSVMKTAKFMDREQLAGWMVRANDARQHTLGELVRLRHMLHVESQGETNARRKVLALESQNKGLRTKVERLEAQVQALVTARDEASARIERRQAEADPLAKDREVQSLRDRLRDAEKKLTDPAYAVRHGPASPERSRAVLQDLERRSAAQMHEITKLRRLNEELRGPRATSKNDRARVGYYAYLNCEAALLAGDLAGILLMAGRFVPAEFRDAWNLEQREKGRREARPSAAVPPPTFFCQTCQAFSADKCSCPPPA